MPDFTELVFDKKSGAAGHLNNKDEISTMLAACCTGVTPPGGTLNKVEFTGIGGVKWGVPGSIEYGTSVTLKFMELQGLPITTIISAWVQLIRDNRTGISNVPKSDYDQTNYSGTLLYWTTTPNAQNVQYYAAYDGIFPLKDPSDLFSSDVETVDKVDIEIEFNVNRVYRDSWVYELCQKKLPDLINSHQMIPGNAETSSSSF